MNRLALASLLGVLAVAGLVPSAFAQTCFDLNTCPIATPLEYFLEPFLFLMGDWTYVAFWGLIGGLIYNRSHNPMLVGFIGILIGTSLVGSNLLSASLNTIPVLVALMGVGTGLVLYHLWKTRMNNP